MLFKKYLGTTYILHLILPAHIIESSCHHWINPTQLLKLIVHFANGNAYLLDSQMQFLVFKRIIDDIIKSNDFEGTFAYRDNITVDGATQQEHDKNLAKVLAVVQNHNLNVE